MSFFNSLKSKPFYFHLLIAIALMGIVLWGLLKFLDIYTLHGETITVPDLKNYPIGEVEIMMEEKGLRYLVVDSVYDSKTEAGAVLEQDPQPNFQVKYNRIIYLTVNAILPPQVKMPDLVDLSLRQAIAQLESCGLKPGNLKYVPDIAFNAVIEQGFKGKKIAPGDMIVKGSAIDLVLGEGESDEMVFLPFLVNLTLEEAIAAISAASLNLGSVVPDAPIKDSTLARVYKQTPAYHSDAMINLGKTIDLFITESPEKIKVDTTNTF